MHVLRLRAAAIPWICHADEHADEHIEHVQQTHFPAFFASKAATAGQTRDAGRYAAADAKLYFNDSLTEQT